MSREASLAHASVMRHGVDASYGYAFADSLSNAIDSVIEQADLTCDGVDLRPAVARAAFIDLVNRPALYDAFVTGSGRVAVAGNLEGDIVQALVPDAALELRARPAWRAVAAAARPVRRAPIDRGDVLVCAWNAKFRRFVDPLVAQLEETVVIGGLVGRARARPPRDLRPYPEILAMLDGARNALDRIRPRVVVAVEGNAPADGVLAAAAASTGVSSVVLQQGWSPQVHAGFRRLPFDAMLVWGQGFAEILGPFNPGLRFDVVGSHAVEEGDGAGEAVGLFLQSTSHLIAPEHVDELVDLARSFAEQVPEVVVREHPSSPLEPIVRSALEGAVTFADAETVALSDVLRGCRSVVSIYSTTLYEAVVAGAFPVSFNKTSLPRLSPSIAEHEVGVETSLRDVAMGAAVSGASEESARRTFQERFFAFNGAIAASRSAAAIAARI